MHYYVASFGLRVYFRNLFGSAFQNLGAQTLELFLVCDGGATCEWQALHDDAQMLKTFELRFRTKLDKN